MNCLDAGSAGPNDSDSLIVEIDARLWPSRGVIRLAFERLNAFPRRYLNRSVNRQPLSQPFIRLGRRTYRFDAKPVQRTTDQALHVLSPLLISQRHLEASASHRIDVTLDL